jgi:hypothetical protein
MTAGPVGARPRLPRGVANGWAVAVAGAGLALALLGPPPAPVPPLGPGNVLTRAAARLPAGSADVRVFELYGARPGRHRDWLFVTVLIYRDAGGRLAVRTLVSPPTGPVPSSPPVGPAAAFRLAAYRRAWPLRRATHALRGLPARAEVVRLQPGGPLEFG